MDTNAWGMLLNKAKVETVTGGRLGSMYARRGVAALEQVSSDEEAEIYRWISGISPDDSTTYMLLMVLLSQLGK